MQFSEDVSLFCLKALSRQNRRVLHTGQGFSSPWLCEDVWDFGNAEAIGEGSDTALPCALGASQVGHVDAAGQEPSWEPQGPPGSVAAD